MITLFFFFFQLICEKRAVKSEEKQIWSEWRVVVIKSHCCALACLINEKKCTCTYGDTAVNEKYKKWRNCQCVKPMCYEHKSQHQHENWSEVNIFIYFGQFNQRTRQSLRCVCKDRDNMLNGRVSEWSGEVSSVRTYFLRFPMPITGSSMTSSASSSSAHQPSSPSPSITKTTNTRYEH